MINLKGLGQMRRLNVAAAIILLGIISASGAWAWGASGHEWVSGIAIEKLPDSVPEFVRTPEAAAEIAVMGRELDRSKGSGKTHDAERDPGHYIDMTNEASVMGVFGVSAFGTDLGLRIMEGLGLVAVT